MFSNYIDKGFKYFEWLVAMIILSLAFEAVWLVLHYQHTMINNIFLGFIELINKIPEKSDKDKAMMASLLTGLAVGLLISLMCGMLTLVFPNLIFSWYLVVLILLISTFGSYCYYISFNNYQKVSVMAAPYKVIYGLVSLFMIMIITIGFLMW